MLFGGGRFGGGDLADWPGLGGSEGFSRGSATLPLFTSS